MSTKDVKPKTVAELKKQEVDLRKKLQDLYFKRATSDANQDHHAVSKLRRELAKTLTLMTKQEKEASNG